MMLSLVVPAYNAADVLEKSVRMINGRLKKWGWSFDRRFRRYRA